MFPGGEPNLQGMLEQVQQMQEQLTAAQQELERSRLQGSAAGGLVTATVSGGGELLELQIDPKIVDPADTETLADAVVAAVRDAMSKASEVQASKMGSLTEGLGDLGGLGDVSGLGDLSGVGEIDDPRSPSSIPRLPGAEGG